MFVTLSVPSVLVVNGLKVDDLLVLLNTLVVDSRVVLEVDNTVCLVVNVVPKVFVEGGHLSRDCYCCCSELIVFDDDLAAENPLNRWLSNFWMIEIELCKSTFKLKKNYNTP